VGKAGGTGGQRARGRIKKEILDAYDQATGK
jgi:hypothetical protein